MFVAAGSLHTVALSEGGALWVWCCGHYGQLGLGDREYRLVPTRLGAGEVFWRVLVRMAACRGGHTPGGDGGGRGVGVWQRRARPLGLNDEDDRLVPTSRRVQGKAPAGRESKMRLVQIGKSIISVSITSHISAHHFYTWTPSEVEVWVQMRVAPRQPEEKKKYYGIIRDMITASSNIISLSSKGDTQYGI